MSFRQQVHISMRRSSMRSGWCTFGSMHWIGSHDSPITWCGRAGETASGTQLGYRIARTAIEWWSGDRGAALAALERLAAQEPGDAGLALYLVQGYLLCGDIKRAVAILEQAHAESTPQAGELDRMRAAVSERSAGEAVTSLSIPCCCCSTVGRRNRTSASSSSAPDLPRPPRVDRLNRDAQICSRPVACRGREGRGGMAVNQVTATAATAQSVAPVPARMMDDLLRHAQSRGMLDALEQAAFAQWERHRGSSHLGAPGDPGAIRPG